MLPRVNIHCSFFQTESSQAESSQTESSQTCESLRGELDCGVYSLTLFPTRLSLYAALAKCPTELGSQNLYHWPVEEFLSSPQQCQCICKDIAGNSRGSVLASVVIWTCWFPLMKRSVVIIKECSINKSNSLLLK